MYSGLHAGTLFKRGPTAKHGWKKRWLVLSETTIRYYKDEKDNKLLGSFDLRLVRQLRTTPAGIVGPKDVPPEYTFVIEVEQVRREEENVATLTPRKRTMATCEILCCALCRRTQSTNG
jgi:hypothetical protein